MIDTGLRLTRMALSLLLCKSILSLSICRPKHRRISIWKIQCMMISTTPTKKTIAFSFCRHILSIVLIVCSFKDLSVLFSFPTYQPTISSLFFVAYRSTLMIESELHDYYHYHASSYQDIHLL
jgi:hypothetical protein